jgi:transposase
MRKKYRCSCGGCVETAIGPDKLFPGARYSIDFAIEVAAAKYIDHAPLERQVRIMAREGLRVTSQTLWDCLEHLARPLACAYQAIHREQLREPVLGADETRWKLFGKEGSKTWQVWIASSPHAAYYRIADNRAFEGAEALLAGYRGIVMCDGYSAYSALAAKRPDLRLAHCWAHVRRKYWEIRASFPEETEHILDLIGKLYAVEQECPQGPEGDSLRADLRQTRSRPIVDEIEAWAWTLYGELDPESALARAMRYMAGVWPGLLVFLSDARVGLDNNPCERAARNPVIGRKNHYGSRSVRGTEVAALFYTLVETAKLAGVEPKTYLRAATRAALRDEHVPTPRELVVALAKDAVEAAPHG